MTDQGRTGYADYDALPDAIKQHYTLKEWLWLTDSQKAGLVQAETGPEWEE